MVAGASPLAALLALSGVSDALDQAREAVDGVLRHPALRRGGALAAEVGLRDAVASAALSGHSYPVPDVRSGVVTDPVVQGALRVSRELDPMAALWFKVPRQVLARMHVLAGRGVVSDDELGRPVADPLVSQRLNTLCSVVLGRPAVPALLLAAVVHGELLAISAFPGPNDVVARAAGRATLIASGLDPRGQLPIDAGHLAREPEYVGASGAFATGTPDGIRSWIKHCAAGAPRGARGTARRARRPGGTGLTRCSTRPGSDHAASITSAGWLTLPAQAA